MFVTKTNQPKPKPPKIPQSHQQKTPKNKKNPLIVFPDNDPI